LEGSIAVIGPLASANHEIREAERRNHERRQAGLAAPRRLTDQLLGQLEELNLEGVGIVPDSYEPALAELRDHLVAWPRVGMRLIERLQPGTPTADLIEVIFTIQEVIAPPTLPAGADGYEKADLL
jgi:hypothetical protein